MPTPETRRLAAIMFTDMVGYSAMAQRNEALAIELLEAHRELLRPLFPLFNGTEIKTIGDAFLIEFHSALEAAQCAIEIQRALAERNREETPERQVHLKIGIHIGDVVHRGGDVYGDGVNIAARIEPLAGAGGICISMDVERQIRSGLDARFVKLAPTELKNISVAMDLFRIILPWETETTQKPGGLSKAQRARLMASAARFCKIAILLLAVVGEAWWFFHRTETSTAPPKTTTNAEDGAPTPRPALAQDPNSIAVLPLENLSDDKDNAYFADGIQDDVLSSLARIKALKVIGRSSVMSYRDVGKRDLRVIGQQLGVANILEGSVRRIADRVLVSVHLTDTRDSREIWAERYDRTLADSLTLQGELATEIATTLRATLSPEEKARVETKPTNNPAAYLLYLRAREFESRQDAYAQNTRAAVALYEKAIAQDPGFALARAQLSSALTYIYRNSESSEAIASKARTEAAEALRLRPDLGEGYLARAYGFYRLDSDYTAALRELETAARLLPNNPDVVYARASILRRQGKWREALTDFVAALALDPRNGLKASSVYETQSMLRLWPEAARSADYSLALAPDSIFAIYLRALVYLDWKGDIAPLRTALAGLDAGGGDEPKRDKSETFIIRCDVAVLDRDFPAALQSIADCPSEKMMAGYGITLPKSYYLGCMALASGDTAAARPLFDAVIPGLEADTAKFAKDPFRHAILGQIYAYQGRKDDALREGRRAVALRSVAVDAVDGPAIEASLAEIYARVGETDAALASIQHLLTVPRGIKFQDLRFRWQWDPLRADPRFQKLLNSPEPTTIY